MVFFFKKYSFRFYHINYFDQSHPPEFALELKNVGLSLVIDRFNLYCTINKLWYMTSHFNFK